MTPQQDIANDDADLSAIDADHLCEFCGLEITVGEYRAAGICTACYFTAWDDLEGAL